MAKRIQQGDSSRETASNWQAEYMKAVDRLELTGTGKSKVKAIADLLSDIVSRNRGKQPELSAINEALESSGLPAATREKFIHLLEHGVPPEESEGGIDARHLAALKDGVDRVHEMLLKHCTRNEERIVALEKGIDELTQALATIVKAGGGSSGGEETNDESGGKPSDGK